MSDVVLKVENLWKQYRLGVVGAGSLREDVGRWMAKVRGKEDPTLKVGETNDRENIKGDYVWALQDINFEIKKGEVVGIIGKNGAGKSTLLKILSKVTTPTKGSIKVKGRIASLLEVGTGFHPELTGRENIFLNGAILGMSKSEIRAKFDEIVDFSGIGKYIDTPVKRYSSGMYVRLAFAVAAHLEPEILIVDEVLAVGDADFQKKCLGKMQDVSQEGRTVLVVSHNMTSIRNICKSGILLQNGKLDFFNDIESVINQYVSYSLNNQSFYEGMANPDKDLNILRVKILNNQNEIEKEINYNDKLRICIQFELTRYLKNVVIWFAIWTLEDNLLFGSCNYDTKREMSNLNQGKYESIIQLPSQFLNSGKYKLVVGAYTQNPLIIYDRISDIVFSIIDTNEYFVSEIGSRNGFLKPLFEWKTTNMLT
ncbi:MAG: ABC transporter ATP-binding protein [Raineya sp.]|nr:ABC transporter ATP-binding protein [Raineya sp.]